MKLPSGECHKILLKISQHCFRQQAIICTNLDLDPCRHMVSQGHNELTLSSTDVLVWSTGWYVKFEHKSSWIYMWIYWLLNIKWMDLFNSSLYFVPDIQTCVYFLDTQSLIYTSWPILLTPVYLCASKALFQLLTIRTWPTNVHWMGIIC